MNTDFLQFVPDVVFEKIPIRNLVANQDYQRNLSESQILRAAEDFDLFQINPVKVSRRNGINYVVDGQHTIEIVALVSQSRDTPVWCMIYSDMEYKHEAQVFADQQKHSRPLSLYDTFVAHLESGSNKHQMILQTVQSYGLLLSSSKKSNGSICAIAALEKIYDKFGFHNLDRTLRICVGTWEGEACSLAGGMLMGVSRLIDTYDDELQDDLFKERIGQYTAKFIARMAKERRPGAIGYAEAIVMLYNKKCKQHRLLMKKLYGNASPGNTDDYEQDEAE